MAGNGQPDRAQESGRAWPGRARSGPRSSVIRTYAAADRASAERSFLREREQAAGRGWEPVSQRWRTEGREQVLTVVYESRDDAPGRATHGQHVPATPRGRGDAHGAMPDR